VAQQEAENPKAARVRDLLRQQRGQTEILSEVWHLDSRERGAAYKTALEEYRAIVAALVGGVL
jgi:dienelactone hydrolase